MKLLACNMVVFLLTVSSASASLGSHEGKKHRYLESSGSSNDVVCAAQNDCESGYMYICCEKASGSEDDSESSDDDGEEEVMKKCKEEVGEDCPEGWLFVGGGKGGKGGAKGRERD